MYKRFLFVLNFITNGSLASQHQISRISKSDIKTSKFPYLQTWLKVETVASNLAFFFFFLVDEMIHYFMCPVTLER